MTARKRAAAARLRMVRGLVTAQERMAAIRPALIAAALAAAGACTVLGLYAAPGSRHQILLYKVIVVADLAAIYLYVAVYTVLQPWWQSRIGRSLVWKDIALSVPLILTAGTLFLNFSRLQSQVASGVDAGALAAIAAILLARSDLWIAEHAARGRGYPSVAAERIADLEAQIARLREAAADEAKLAALKAETARLQAMLAEDPFLADLAAGIFQATPDAIAIVSAATGTIIAANGPMADLAGYPVAEMAGMAVEALVPAALAVRHAGHRQAYARDPSVRPMGQRGTRLHLVTRDGQPVPVDINLAPVRTGSGLYVVAAVRTRTE